MIDLGINTQTPPVASLRKAGAPKRGAWVLGRDYRLNRGGVIPMMRSLLRAGRGSWIGRKPLWVALGDESLPASLETDEGYRLELVTLGPKERRSYQRFKESIWRSFHGPAEFIPQWKDYAAFVAYGHASAQALLAHADDCDLFYVNDFQQLLVGGLIGTAAPALLHWHIPVDFRGYPEPVRRFFLKAMEGFDVIVVSTRQALEQLIAAGFQGRAFQVYPFFDPRDYPVATPSQVVRFRQRYGISDDAPVVLSVARLDPVKRQDILVRAAREIGRRVPGARILLIGGGSFSTRMAGPTSKAGIWRQHLERLCRQLGVRSTVILGGEVTQEDLAAAYTTANVFVHPAPWEGFGLVVAEAWHYGRPVVVSDGAGVAELVTSGVNGYRVSPGRVDRLAHQVVHLLKHPSEAERLGAEGRQTAHACYIQEAAPRMRPILERAIDLYASEGISRRRASRTA